MLYGAEATVRSQINTKHTQCGRKVQLLNVKLGASRNQ